MAEELVKRDEPSKLTIPDLVDQVATIQEAMSAVMKSDVHYGVIPGTDKPTLLKPGAEKLCLLFRLDPEYNVTNQVERDDFISYTVTCTLIHIPTNAVIASGYGACNTRENKYRYRNRRAAAKPSQKEADRLKEEGKGFWRKLGGDWAWFDKIENDNPWELQNTILKMACKRALVAAVLNATAASDIFAQDLEDLPRYEFEEVVEAKVVEPGLPVVEAKVKLATPTLVKKLRAQLAPAAERAPELWSENVVIANAKRAFREDIAELEDLTKEEAEQIMEGAKKWTEDFDRLSEEHDQKAAEESELEELPSE